MEFQDPVIADGGRLTRSGFAFLHCMALRVDSVCCTLLEVLPSQYWPVVPLVVDSHARSSALSFPREFLQDTSHRTVFFVDEPT